MPNDLSSVDDFVSGNETVSTDTSGVHGKYFFVNVPQYNGQTTYAYDAQGNLSIGSAKTSFLRIGAPNVPWITEPGADLARLVYVVGPAGNGTPNPDAGGKVEKIRDPDILARFSSPTLPDGTANPEFMSSFYDIICPAKTDAHGNEVTDAHGNRVVDEDAAPAVFPPFIDDLRHRGTGNENPEGPSGHGFTSAQRKAISNRLEKDCGWRDHADGNRITTTAGDKIEVIQGNYKLIVLGRTSDIGQGMGWEATGNNVQDFAGATMPGASVTVTWIKEAYNDAVNVAALQAQLDALNAEKTAALARVAQIDQQAPHASHYGYHGGQSPYQQLMAERQRLLNRIAHIDGTDIPAKQKEIDDGNAFNDGYKGGAWLLQNSTERVYQYSRNAGNFKEENWGDLLESYVGSENPARVGKKDGDGMQGHPTAHYKHDNPASPLAEKMPTVSSVGLPRGNPHIIEKTWATKIESYTGSAAWRVPLIHEETWAVATSDETHVSGGQSSKTYAGSIDDETHCDGTINEKTFAGAMTEVVAAGAIASTTNAAVIVENTNAGVHVELHAGLLHSSIEIGNVIDLYVGGKIDIDLSKTLEVTLIEHDEYKTKEKKAQLEKMEVALRRAQFALSSNNTNINHVRRALQQTIQALKVNIGI